MQIVKRLRSLTESSPSESRSIRSHTSWPTPPDSSPGRRPYIQCSTRRLLPAPSSGVSVNSPARLA